jgi:hypothetical protein
LNAHRLPAAAAAAALVASLAAPGRSRADDAAVREFEQRARAYVEVRQSAEKSLPPLSPTEADAAVIRAHREALADAVRRARAEARPGDVFVPSVRPLFRAVVAEEVRRQPAQRRTIEEGNPEREKGAPVVDYAVNAPYPDGAPSSTVPPALLARLPRLPDDLQYRFSGRHLLLVDARARIVVDFLGQAVPQ